MRGSPGASPSRYLSAHTLHEAFALGINGTVSKRAPKHVLVHAAREVLAGRGFQCEFTARELRETPACKALSDSERRILRLVADGCEAKEIAAELGLSQKTVLNNLVSLRQKSGLQSMVDLARFATAHGLADCE